MTLFLDPEIVKMVLFLDPEIIKMVDRSFMVSALVLRPVSSTAGLCWCWLGCTLASRGRLPLSIGRGRQGFVESRATLGWEDSIHYIKH